MNVLSPLDETVRDLTLTQHLPRIKKLLVYACTHHWESDAAGLSAYHLHDLVQQLLQITPTLSALKAHLSGVIQTLNKPTEYTLVANIIVRHLQTLYPDATSYDSEHYKTLYYIAAQHLEQDDDVDRMKKLIHFVCRDQWTHDHDMDALGLYELIEELHSLTLTSAELNAVLENVVQAISKPDKYRAIAQRIIQGLAPLYQSPTYGSTHAEQDVPSLPEDPLLAAQSIQSSDSCQTEFLPQADEKSAVQSSKTQPTEIIKLASVNNSGRSTGQPKAGQPKTGQPKTGQPKTGQTKIEPQEKRSKPLSMRKKVASLASEELFALRHEINKFTNPLLAKHILLMTSYAAAVQHDPDSQPGQWDVMVWDALKANDLETLLCDGLKQCRNLGEFERSLKRTARQFSHKRSKQYSAVISAIVRAVTPMFADCQEPSGIVYAPVQEEFQGTPTYGKRSSLDDSQSKPLTQGTPDTSWVASNLSSPLTFETPHIQNRPLKPISEQETSIEPPRPILRHQTVGLTETGPDPTEALEPTESEAYLEKTETECLPDKNTHEQILWEQDKHLEQGIEQQLHVHPINTLHRSLADEDTRYLEEVPSGPNNSGSNNSGSNSSLAKQWSLESPPTPPLKHRNGRKKTEPQSNKPQSEPQVMDETYFLPSP